MAKKETENKVVRAPQLTKPNEKLSNKPRDGKPGFMLGASGTVISEGIISEEYNSSLEGQSGAAIWEEMRKSDAQVAATLAVCELPLKSTKWYVDPYVGESGESDGQAQEISDFVTWALFDAMDLTWGQLLDEIFTFLPFGHAVFEKQLTGDGDKVWFKTLASRKQTTILKWEQEDGTSGIRQVVPQEIEGGPNDGEKEVDIPSHNLVIFTHKKEGENHEGVSLLRPAYKHWHIKSNLYKFDAVKHERAAVGIPVMYMPSTASQADRAAAQDIVDNVRISEQVGIVIPGTKEEGWLFEFAQTHGDKGSNIFESVKHHNREISKVILAQFLELGTDGGSQALSRDQTSLYRSAVEFIGKHITDVFNRYVIPELVDMNFETDQYPQLKFRKIGELDYSDISSGLKSLADSGIIIPDDEIEAYIRDMFDLPARDTDGDDVERGQRGNTDGGGEPTKKTDPNGKGKQTTIPNKKEVKKEVDKATKAHEHDDVGVFDEDYHNLSSKIDNKMILSLQNEVTNLDQKARLKKKGFKFNEFEKNAVRPLTFAERKVNFTSLKRSMDSFGDLLEKQLTDITKKQRDDILKQLKSAVDKNDVKAIGKLKIKFKTELAAALTNVQKEMFEIGKKSAATEMVVKIPPTNAAVRGAMRVQNSAIADELINKMENVVRINSAELITKRGGDIKDLASAEAVAAVSVALDKVIGKAIKSLDSLTVTGSVNMGRASIFERYPEKVYAMQYSAIIDGKTTDHCLSLDGRVVKPGSNEYFNYMPPQHYGCRSIWVEILVDEVFKPAIDGIPSSIPATKTIDTATLLKVPIVSKDSPAIRIIQTEIKQRKDKLRILTTAGNFPNRQKNHKKRISELEKAIKTKLSEDRNLVSNYFKDVLIADGIKF